MSEQRVSQLNTLWNYILGTIGAVIGGGGIVVFLAPADIAGLGVGGVAVLLNALFSLPIGLMILVLNVPILYLAYKMLPGGLPMVFNMTLFTIVYSAAAEVLSPVMSTAITEDRLLSAIFGGVVLGISGGLMYRSGNALGGTYALAMILRRRTGTPMSTTYFVTDMGVVLASGLVFGIEGALYSTIVLFLNGVAQDYVMEGPSVVRNVMIVTDKPDEIADWIMQNIFVGVTRVDATGMYRRQARGLLYVTISRARAPVLRQLVSEIDPGAFMVIGHGHVAYGGGFKPMTPRFKAKKLDADAA